MKPIVGKRLKRFLGAFLALLALLLLISIGHRYTHGRDHIWKNLQENLWEEEQRAAGQLNVLMSTVVQDSSYLAKPLFISAYQTILVYKNDSLVYWSDNDFEVPRRYDSTWSNSLLTCDRGDYLLLNRQEKAYRMVALIQIQNRYSVQNRWLEPSISPRLSGFRNFTIESTPSAYPLKKLNGQTVLYIHFTGHANFSLEMQNAIFVFLMLFYAFCIWGLFRLYKHRLPWFFVGSLLIRLACLMVHWPEWGHPFELFGPYLYAASFFSPSLGDQLLNLIMVASWMLVFWHTAIVERRAVHWSARGRMAFVSVLTLGLIPWVCWYVMRCRALVLCSSFHTDFNDVSSFSIYLLFVLLAMLFAGVTLMLYTIITLRSWRLINKTWKRPKRPSLIQLMWLAVALSAVSAVLYNNAQTEKEQHERLALARKISKFRNISDEFRFREVYKKVAADSLLWSYIHAPQYDERRFLDSLQKCFDSPDWEFYNFEITVCSPKSRLLLDNVKEPVMCRDFFQQKIQTYGHAASVPAMYVVNEEPGRISYLSEWRHDDVRVYIEFVHTPPAGFLDFPELFESESSARLSLSSGYAYGYYSKGDLVSQFGSYSYPLRSFFSCKNLTNIDYLTDEGFDHLVFPLHSDECIVVSKQTDTGMHKMASFAYIFLFNVLLVFLFFLVQSYPYKKLWLSFSSRIQFVILSIVFVSFLITGFTTIVYIGNLNHQKNLDFLREKAYSVLLEMEFEYGNDTTIHADARLKSSIFDIANILFTNVHFYSPEGYLLSTTQNAVFEKRLLGNRIHRTALHALREEHQNFYIQRESIGQSYYYAMYLPLRNRQNVLLGYINLPMFTREAELRAEISTFLSSFVSIYVLFLLLAFVAVIGIASRVSRPLREIAERLRSLDLTSRNRKLPVIRRDEIGALILEYNRMVDELEQSAHLLAESERRGAWSEMAKQVAHEIKNPLTPMKLSVQQLERAWKDQHPEFGQRLRLFTELMTEQIDQLSVIASEFSNFSQLTKPRPQKVDLARMVRNLNELYKTDQRVQLSTTMEPGLEHAFLDDAMLQRVLINLLKNAYQAVENIEPAHVSLTVMSFQVEGVDWIGVEVSDNGPGIPIENREHIFEPNFTTKSSGMGLGLAISRNSVAAMGGNLLVLSQEGRGATLRVELPRFASPE